MSKFIHNKSTAKVSLINGSILIDIGGKHEATDQQLEHEDVIHAKRSGWISVEGEQSVTKAPATPAGIKPVEDPMKGSATIPEVKPKETATSSLLGSEEKKEQEVETKPKKAKKAEDKEITA